MADLLPSLSKGVDLLALLDVERLVAFCEDESRAHQVHALFCGPDGGVSRPRAPPDAIAQTRRERLQAQQAGWVREHRPRIRLSKPLTFQELEEDLRVAARHVRIGLTFFRLITKVAEAIDHLLRRAATDT